MLLDTMTYPPLYLFGTDTGSGVCRRIRWSAERAGQATILFYLLTDTTVYQ